MKPTVVDILVVSPSGRTWKVLALQRAKTTRCPGAWETVHGRISAGETAHAAAARELREETGFTADRLYIVMTHPFYLHRPASIEVAVAFCAFVRGAPRPILGEEHSRAQWLSRTDAMKRLAWPTERLALSRAWDLLARGDAGALEDVLRVRP